MKTPHKHAALIHAWADGATIQWLSAAGWEDCVDYSPGWFNDEEYRIKPEPKPDVVQHWWFSTDSHCSCFFVEPKLRENLRLTFDGETGALKSAEVING